jgi:hypothetical protein
VWRFSALEGLRALCPGPESIDKVIDETVAYFRKRRNDLDTMKHGPCSMLFSIYGDDDSRHEAATIIIRNREFRLTQIVVGLAGEMRFYNNLVETFFSRTAHDGQNKTRGY